MSNDPSVNIERKLAAILAADVVGYSSLMGRGEEETLRRLKQYRSGIDESIEQHGGRIFGSAGDSVIAEFPSPVQAVRCAAAIQRTLAKRNAELSQDQRMQLRIGVNLGDVMVEGDNLLGDAVNIAARLESLADAGGVCISEEVYRHVGNKLKLDFQDLGQQSLKNIAEPVRVYRVLLTAAPKSKSSRRWLLTAALGMILLVTALALWRLTPHEHRPLRQALREFTGPALPDKPSIAVLPFDNMSGDPAQDYFSDGMTDDIITELSRFPDLFVISRNSVFTYKGRPVKIQQVGRELGVRYVLEGSVRRSEDRVRINAQLIDAQSGGHLWAERFDRDIEDVFAVQDEVTGRIVAALAGEVTATELERVRRQDTKNLRAYDYVLRGMDQTFRHTPEDNAKARELYQKAVELDPDFGRAYAHLAWTYLNDWIFGWNADPEQSLERAFEIAQKAVALDDANFYAHGVLGSAHLWRKQHEQAIAEWRRAIALNPNAAEARAEMGDVLIWAGRPKEGLEYVKEAIRLNPKQPFFYSLWSLGHGYFVAGQYEDAVAALTRLRDRNPRFGPTYIYLTAAFARLGRLEEARAAKAQADVFFPVSDYPRMKAILPYKNPADLQRLFDSLNLIETG